MDAELADTIQYQAVHTYELGSMIGSIVQPGLVIALQGELGSGKTTFTQGLAIGMGIEDRITSPTFTLVNEYGGGSSIRLIHIDTYRLGELPQFAILESATFGLEEMLDPAYLTETEAGAVVVIEWAERVQELLPEDHLLIQIESDGVGQLRNVLITSKGPASSLLLRHLRNRSIS